MSRRGGSEARRAATTASSSRLGGIGAGIDLDRSLADACPAALLPLVRLAVRWRQARRRLIAVLPNAAWQEVFDRWVDGPLRQALATEGWQLDSEHALLEGAELTDIDGSSQTPTTFTTFLRDPGNQFAYSACRAAIEAPGIQHNPLYLHGPAGCGKTHLLAALADECRELMGEELVVELDGAAFVETGAQVLAERRDDPLTLALERAAVVCFDRLELVAGRDLAQEELYLLINHGLELGQQLVFAGRLAPRRLGEVEDRLATRLSWGLVVPIDQPLAETRLTLLRRLLGNDGPAVAPARLAELVDQQAPDMHQVVRLAERLRAGEGVAGRSDVASFDRIIAVVAEAYGVRPADIASKHRHRQVVTARQTALLLGRRLTGHSLVALGGMVGGRDHSTVLHALRRAEERQATDAEFARELDGLVRRILEEGAGG